MTARSEVSWRWWGEASIDLEGAKKMEEEAAMVSELESDFDLKTNPGREEELRGASGSS